MITNVGYCHLFMVHSVNGVPYGTKVDPLGPVYMSNEKRFFKSE